MGAGRGSFGTRFGFYLAAIGSAFGLGNVWRFPYIVAENGGGAFVLLYVFLVFILGLPFLLGELFLGSSTKSSVIRSIGRSLADQSEGTKLPVAIPWRSVGIFATLLCLVVLSYYAVISGWVLHYVAQFLAGFFDSSQFRPQDQLALLLENGWLQILLTSVHLLIVLIVVEKDVEEGIEKAVGYMMPVFILLLSILFFKVITLPSAGEAIRFFLYPDFSSLTLSSLGQAIGHVFFTLSIGFGTMVTFGSYLEDRVYIPLAGFRVATIDSFLSLFAGLLVFPLVFGAAISDPGPDLLFRTVPVLMARIAGGHWFALAFFVCLYLAALGASIGLFETVVSNLIESFRIKRRKACMIVGAGSFFISIVPALSSSVFGGLSLGGQGLLEFFDGLLINWGLPLSALLIAQFVFHRLPESKIRDIFTADEQLQASALRMYAHWRFALKWVAVPLIVAALSLQVIALFRG